MSTGIGDRKKYVRPHDSWQCASPDESSCGGSGNHGDGRCVPVPSVRLQREIFTVSCTALILGILVACVTGPNRNEFFAPGPLSDSHAQILVDQGSRRCASCHGAGDRSLTEWIQDAVTAGRHIPVSQSQLCMDCHDKSLATEFALHAHTMSPDRLNEITLATPASHSRSTTGDPRNAAGQLACATCHREHHGAEFNLTALTDQQCQTCHVNYIHSFEKDHPEFTNWPFAERSGIAFDHVSHGIKHFRERNMEFNCQQCHIDDARGEVKLVASFEMSCASCHQEQITGDAAPDWTLFRLPMLDMDAIAETGQSVGEWPEMCSGDFDGQLSPSMKMLLMADPATATVLEERGPEFEFADLDPDQPGDVADAVTLAWAIKELLHDLGVRGNAEIRDRVERVLDTSLDPGDLSRLTSGLHDAVFEQAAQRWLPSLRREVRARRGDDHAGQADLATPPLFARPATLDDEEVLATNPLANRYPVTARQDPSAPASPAADRPRIVNNPRSPAEASGRDGQRISNTHTDNRQDIPRGTFEGSDDVLAINPLSGLTSKTNQPVPAVPDDEAVATPPRYEAIKQAITRLAPADPGGWFRNDRDFSISYRVAAHLDPLMQGWTDLAMENHTHRVVQQTRLFETLNSGLAAGQCRTCHTADTVDGKTSVNWRPRYRDTSIRGFTRFSHRPHEIQTALQGCTSCHQLDETRSNHASFAGFDSRKGLSNFAPISKSSCASCHRKGGAPGGCVDCHNYHVGSRISGER